MQSLGSFLLNFAVFTYLYSTVRRQTPIGPHSAEVSHASLA